MQPTNAWKDERGYIAPIFLAVVSVILMLSWVAVALASTHFVSAARQTRDIQAGQLARAGVEAALAEIDENDVPREQITGQEETGTYEVTITPTGRGTYTVVSTGTANNQTRTITAEVAPPPEPFAVLAGGNVKILNGGVVGLASIMNIDGDVNAGGNVELESNGGLLLSLGTTLNVQGDVRAGGNVALKAIGGLLLNAAFTNVDGSVYAGRDVTLEAKGAVAWGHVDVDGPVVYGRKITKETGMGSVSLHGGTQKVEGVTIEPVREADTAYFEALVADLEAKGEMEYVSPRNACGTIERNTRITGDLKNCNTLKIKNDAVVVVDGSVDIGKAEVQGLLYVRGAAVPDSSGHVNIDSLSLLELIGELHPLSGGGMVAATGNISVGKGLLARLLAFGSKQAVSQVLALTAGPEDNHNDIEYHLGGLIEGVAGSKAAPLLLYAGGNGNITVKKSELIDAINIEGLPMIVVAGGDVTIESKGLAEVVGVFTIEAWPDIWQYAPPFLQGMGRSWVMTWEWSDSSAVSEGTQADKDGE